MCFTISIVLFQRFDGIEVSIAFKTGDRGLSVFRRELEMSQERIFIFESAIARGALAEHSKAPCSTGEISLWSVITSRYKY